MKSKLNDRVTATICNAIERGHFIEHAVQLAGITKPTYYDWQRRGEAGEELYTAFFNAIKTSEAKLLDRILAQVQPQIASAPQNWPGWFRFLESRFPRHYRREITVKQDEEQAAERIKALLEAFNRPRIETINDDVSTHPVEEIELTGSYNSSCAKPDTE